MARRSFSSSPESTVPLFRDGPGNARSVPQAKPLSVADQTSADRRRMQELAERFAAGWRCGQPLAPPASPDGRRAAAADPSDAAVRIPPDVVKRLFGAIEDVIDWIATQVCMHRIPGTVVRDRPWPDLEHDGHLAKRSGLTRDEWERLIGLLRAEPVLPIVGRLIPRTADADWHWSPEEGALAAWYTRWDWRLVHETAERRMAG